MAGSILGGSTRDAPGASRIKTVENQSVQPARSDGWENTPRPPSLRARLSRCVAFGRTADLPEEHPRLKRRHRVRAEHGSHDRRFDLWPAPGCPGQSIDESSHPVNGTLTAFLLREASRGE